MSYTNMMHLGWRDWLYTLLHYIFLPSIWNTIFSLMSIIMQLLFHRRRVHGGPVSLLGRTAHLYPHASGLYLTLLLEEQIPQAAVQTHRNAKCQSVGLSWPYWVPHHRRDGRRWDMREDIESSLNLDSLDGDGGSTPLACQLRCFFLFFHSY